MSFEPIITPPSSPQTAENANPLSSEQVEQICAAKNQVKGFISAVNLASFNFWCFAIGAAVSLLAALFFPSGLIAVACLALLAYNERRGGRLVRNFESKGALLLFYNQLGCLFLITVYCFWQIAACCLNPTPFDGSADSSLIISQLLSGAGVSRESDPDMMKELYRTVVVSFYLAIVVLSALFQGLCAWSYYRKYKLLEDFLRQTPTWVLTVLKATS